METKATISTVIIITGAESTGKTQLARQLANYYSCKWVPELSREYVESLNRKYNYSDIEKIARIQIEQLQNALAGNELVFFDTGLIITKVWMQVVYNKCPNWLIDAMSEMPDFLYLLCDIDLPWVADSVRENGGEMRHKLHEIYQQEFKLYNQKFEIISGTGDLRLYNAIKAIKKYSAL